jgi:hypothetical protein
MHFLISFLFFIISSLITDSRATAVIARVFEVVPILLLSFVLFLAGTYPRELETIVDLGQMEFSLMVASLTNTNV